MNHNKKFSENTWKTNKFSGWLMFWYSPNQPKDKKPEDHIPGEPEEVLPAKDNDFSKDHRSREMITELGLLYHYAVYLLQTSKQASKHYLKQWDGQKNQPFNKPSSWNQKHQSKKISISTEHNQVHLINKCHFDDDIVTSWQQLGHQQCSMHRPLTLRIFKAAPIWTDPSHSSFAWV